ncbi:MULTISPECIES: PPC domain-containing protein [unclassified Brevundimonas]|uniref:PPC domain-containing protein n=1 Tax=unclassified Brevundimonas TaxID=2622653 RepID=UPI0025C1059B|nr:MULTISPECIES: peptidase [unclassified Brevundimonas]
MKNSLFLACSLAVLSLAASPSLAQEQGGPITIGRSVSVAVPDEGVDYVLELRVGQRIESVMRSSDIDSYQEIYLEGATDDALASNDDGFSDSVDSRLVFTPGEAGRYILRVGALGFQESGQATLEVNNAPAREARANRIAIGRTVNGRLGSRSAEDDEGNSFDLYRLRLDRGDRVAIRLKSDDFDPYLSVGQSRNGVYQELASNDDGEDLNSYLVFTAPESGEFDIRARSLAGSAEGRYAVSVENGPPRPVSLPLAIGEPVAGRIDDKSPQNMSGGRSVYYSLNVRAGESYEVALTSDDFDTYLEVFDPHDKSIAADDDSGGDLNSRLQLHPEEDAVYTIEARPLSSGITGDFEIKVETVAPPPPPSSLAFNTKVDGEITDEDASADSYRYDAYTVSLTEGQRVQVVMRSADFDSYLEIGRDAKPFETLAEDDDGLGQGLNARLLFEAPEAGDYVIRARPFGDDRGAYDIELSDRGPDPKPGSVLVGSTVRSSLSDRDNTADGGAFFDDYVFQAKADEKLRFIMAAQGFDALVRVGQIRNGEFRELASDDDGLSDTHARLNWTAPREGEYVVRATSFAPNSTGEYILTVERQP